MATLGRERRAGSQVRRTVVIVAIVLAVGFVVVQTSPRVRNAVAPLRAGMDDILVAATARLPKASGWGFGGDAALREEVQSLRVENRKLAIWRDAATSMSERMLRYEELLNLSAEPIPNGISARVVTETSGPFAETRLANAGARNGVEEGYIAVNTQGVVGRIVAVGNRSSRILLVTDFNSRVPVMGEISGVRGILAGGRGEEYGQLIDTPEREAFIPGESLLTTGEGNVFPRGLRVGTIVESGDDWSVRLTLSEAPMDFVRLLPPLTVPKPEDEPAIIRDEPSPDLEPGEELSPEETGRDDTATADESEAGD